MKSIDLTKLPCQVGDSVWNVEYIPYNKYGFDSWAFSWCQEWKVFDIIVYPTEVLFKLKRDDIKEICVIMLNDFNDKWFTNKKKAMIKWLTLRFEDLIYLKIG